MIGNAARVDRPVDLAGGVSLLEATVEDEDDAGDGRGELDRGVMSELDLADSLLKTGTASDVEAIFWRACWASCLDSLDGLENSEEFFLVAEAMVSEYAMDVRASLSTAAVWTGRADS